MDDSLESIRSKPVPTIPEDLVEDLDARFPHRCPGIHDSERAIWIYAGQRQMVEFLKETHRRQIEDSFRGFSK